MQTQTVFELVEGDGRTMPVDVDLEYDPENPLAIQLVLAVGTDAPVRWMVSRDLLLSGLRGVAGEGDVRVRRLVNDVSLLELGAKGGIACFRVPSSELIEFVAETYDAIPPWHEQKRLAADLDGVLAAILWGTEDGESKAS
jgi:hypothetical protein